jgi:hypothetical protein
MWAEAILVKSDLAELAAKFCPLRIHIGEGGNVLLSEPRDLELVPGVGLRMTVTSEIHWPVLGIQIPVSVRSAVLEVKLEILETASGDTLTFRLHLDDVDISILPAFVDRKIVDLVNAELEAKHVELSWRFAETLSHIFALPEALASASALDLRAASGRVRITSEGVAFAVSFQANVEPRTVGERSSTEVRETNPVAVSRAHSIG